MSSLLASTQKTYPASLLLNFDGANNSTTFTDSSSYNHTGTAYGNAKISTTQSKFGGSSGYFDGAGDYVQYAANSAFAFGSDPFTVEMWIYCSSLPTPGNIAGLVGTYSTLTSVNTTHWWFGLDNRDSTNRLTITRHGDNVITANCIWTPNLNTWYHIAASKDSNNNIYIYINGESQSVNSTNNWASYNVSSNGPLGIGLIATPFYFNGYIDSLRITKGVALYTGSAHPLPNIPSSKNAVIAPKLNNHIVMTSTKSTGDISGYVTTSSGYYTVNWWDGTKTTYSSGANFSRAAIGGNQTITIYPSKSDGTLDGNFKNINIANNSLSSVRMFYSKILGDPDIPGFANTWYYWYNSYTGWNRSSWVPAVAGIKNSLDISFNNLSSSSLNQLYTDLLDGIGIIEVSDNTGCDADDPSIATNKGYTVFGSLSPITELLLNFNGTNGSTTFTDSSTNNRSITLQTGSPSLNTTTKQYGTASLSVNSGSIGNESYIIPDLSNMDWSIEFWIYRPTATAAYEGIVYLASSAGVDNRSGANIHLYTNNDINFNDNGAAAVVSNTNVTSGVWHHVACVQDSKYKKVFFNGVLMGVAQQTTPPGPYKIRIGRSYGYWANSASTAYIDDLKIVRGKCAYYQDFVPPTAELTNGTALIANGTTVLLLNGNGSDGSTTFTDSGHKNLTPTRNGNTIISTTAYKYGTASLYFDGTGDYLTYVTGKDNFNFFNSNFTIECWIRPASVTGTRVIFSKRANTSTIAGLIFQLNGNKLSLNATNNGSSWGINIDSIASLSTNTWYHVAVTRFYDTFRIFIDGNLENSQSIEDFIIPGNTANMVIGAGGASGSQEFSGYIDDLRIIRGVSLYNSNFTAPTAQLGIYP